MINLLIKMLKRMDELLIIYKIVSNEGMINIINNR